MRHSIAFVIYTKSIAVFPKIERPLHFDLNWSLGSKSIKSVYGKNLDYFANRFTKIIDDSELQLKGEKVISSNKILMTNNLA